MPDETPKLHIDDDWKNQAAAEKARLAEKTDGPSRATQEANIAGLIQLIAMQAVVGLGGMVAPGGQEIPPNLALAKHHIDILSVLEKKTAGNLTPDEKRLLDTTLHQLRMAYVDAVQGPSAPPPAGVNM